MVITKASTDGCGMSAWTGKHFIPSKKHRSYWSNGGIITIISGRIPALDTSLRHRLPERAPLWRKGPSLTLQPLPSCSHRGIKIHLNHGLNNGGWPIERMIKRRKIIPIRKTRIRLIERTAKTRTPQRQAYCSMEMMTNKGTILTSLDVLNSKYLLILGSF